MTRSETESDSGYQSLGSSKEFDGTTTEPWGREDSNASRAMEEYSGVMRYQAKAVRSDVVRDAAVLFMGGQVPTAVALEVAQTARTSHYVVRVRDGRLVSAIGCEVSKLSVVYDPWKREFFPVRRDGGLVRVSEKASEWCYASSALEVYNQDQLANVVETVKNLRVSVVDVPAMRFVQGVFGAGKTREVISLLRGGRTEGKAILYLSATRSSATQVRDAVWQDDSRGLQCVRTLDSYLLNSSEEFTDLVVDEAPMAHSAQIIAACLKSGARSVVCYGDRQQIPWVSFADAYPTPLQDGGWLFVSIEERPVTHRCRLDVCAAWVDKYDGRLYPCTCCEHVLESTESMSVERIRSVVQVPRVDGMRYMVFTQAEKVELASHLGLTANITVLREMKKGGLATVHEDQGMTHDKVILVRLRSRFDRKRDAVNPDIYNNPKYALTAMTRHRLSFVYYTTSEENDQVCQRVVASGCPYRRAVASREAKWEDVKSRCMSV